MKQGPILRTLTRLLRIECIALMPYLHNLRHVSNRAMLLDDSGISFCYFYWFVAFSTFSFAVNDCMRPCLVRLSTFATYPEVGLITFVSDVCWVKSFIKVISPHPTEDRV